MGKMSGVLLTTNRAVIQLAGGTLNTQPFYYLQVGNEVATDANMRGTVASSYKLFLAIGVIGIVTTLIIGGLTIASAPASRRAEVLHEILGKMLIGIVLFSLPTIISFIMQIATALV